MDTSCLRKGHSYNSQYSDLELSVHGAASICSANKPDVLNIFSILALITFRETFAFVFISPHISTNPERTD